MAESSNFRGNAPANILATQPVSASEWASAVRLHNHLAGRGRVLVPAFKPAVAGKTSVGQYTYAIYLVPSYQTLVRQWRVSARVDGELKMDVNSGAIQSTKYDMFEFPDIPSSEPARSIQLEEVLSSQSASELEYDLQLTATVAGTHTSADFEVDSIECYEVPRVVIAETGTENGARLSPFRSTQPVTAAAFANMYAGSQDVDIGRRVHFHTALPYKKAGIVSTSYCTTITSTSFVDLFDVAKSCVARKIYNDGNAYTACTLRIHCWVDAGTAEVRVTTAEGTSSTITISATAPEWSAVISDVNVACEDFTEDDGLPAAGYDDVQVEVRKITSGSFYISGTILYE